MENKNEQEEQRPIIMKMKREQLSNIGIFIGLGLLGFWFGIGATFRH